MPKTWDNVPCKFRTQNDANDRPNSEYHIYTNRILRCAPVNIDRSGFQDQVFMLERKSICYLDTTSTLYDLIGNLTLEDRNRITIDSVVHDDVYLNVFGTVLPATRIPQNGLAVFDCFNNNGVIDYAHLGHNVCDLNNF